MDSLRGRVISYPVIWIVNNQTANQQTVIGQRNPIKKSDDRITSRKWHFFNLGDFHITLWRFVSDHHLPNRPEEHNVLTFNQFSCCVLHDSSNSISRKFGQEPM